MLGQQGLYWSSSLKDDNSKIAFKLEQGKSVDVSFEDSNYAQLTGYKPNYYVAVGLLMVRDGKDSGQYANALKKLPAEADKVKLTIQGRIASAEKAAQDQMDRDKKERDSWKRVQEGLKRENDDYNQRQKLMRQSPKVNDIAVQGRVLEVRGDQVRVEVYQKVCVQAY